ncbi:LOW QUALITY PROTEIN: uncharacterized protein ACOB6Z_009829 [Ctenodactylus gundi]
MAVARNNTVVTMFILLGLSEHPHMKLFLFGLFLGIYLLTLAWNLSLIALIRMDSHLRTPMYFFLSNLSFLDICYVSSTAPKMLWDVITGQKAISFIGCATQYFAFYGMGHCFLLATMADDRYAAICNPLLYTTLCLKMVIGAYVGGFLSSVIETYSAYQHDFCGPNMINHFFRDLPPVLALSCSDTFTSLTFLVGVVVGVVSILAVLISYGYIAAAVLRISSAKGRTKAFSTCASHLTAVTLFYGSRSSSSYSLNRDKVVSIFYAVMIPMVNPIIYSLRNKDIKNVMRNAVVGDHTRSFTNILSHFLSDMRSPKAMTHGENSTDITQLILLGFSDLPRITPLLFTVFLLTYLATVTWNLSLIVFIRMDSHLHTPMYFFLSNLSFIDLCCITSTVPKMLSGFFQERQRITFIGCIVQNFIFSTMGLSESCLMTAMAYDRAAICNPLLYSSVMSPTLCTQMVPGRYTAGLAASLSQLYALLQLHFCGPNVIRHFFCDTPQLLPLSCTDTFLLQILTAALTMIFGIANVIVITTSYGYIVTSIMKITSATGRSKAFNTCASHLTAVSLFYTSSIFVYLSSSSGASSSFDRFASVFYTVVIPMLNPLIYSLRNKEIKDALKRLQMTTVYC